ncbi:MAG: type II toxin-antitoxin system HicA family toxin [Candidatus Handelsmanbacteria bacterium]|nr:type II toxin-antitoxin system HicA family toxin [Candidatus Handelsmanbacteria bacterium]
MNRSEFFRQLLREGCVFVRHGARHDIDQNPVTGKKQSVPRHAEIDGGLVRHIRKNLGLAL